MKFGRRVSFGSNIEKAHRDFHGHPHPSFAELSRFSLVIGLLFLENRRPKNNLFFPFLKKVQTRGYLFHLGMKK